MFIVDDPMLALIMRFVCEDENLDIPYTEFLQRQITEIEQYVRQHPKEEETIRAMEWIEEHAKKYRGDWQKNVAARKFSEERCPDCPLIADDSSSHCEIHDQWVALLHSYASSNITSRKYVENALRLLEEHKANLNVCSTSKSMPIKQAAESGG